jgi:hypothetical protein
VEPILEDRIHREAVPDFLQDGKTAIDEMMQNIPNLTEMHYKENDLDLFCQTAIASKSDLSQFLLELEENKQIDSGLREKMVCKYKLKKIKRKIPSVFRTYLDLTFFFLKDCLKSHMRKGSLFSCFSQDPVSKLEDHLFFEHIITNSTVDFREKLVSIKSPAMKKGKKGLILVIEKLV